MQISRAIQLEVWLSFFAVGLIPIALLPWATCEDGMPLVGYLLFVPLLVRSKILEFAIVGRLQSTNGNSEGCTAGLVLATAWGSGVFRLLYRRGLPAPMLQVRRGDHPNVCRHLVQISLGSLGLGGLLSPLLGTGRSCTDQQHRLPAVWGDGYGWFLPEGRIGR